MRLVWLVVLAACGGKGGVADSGTPSGAGGGVDIAQCSDPFAACGGDPTGTWNVEAVCDPGLSEIMAMCPSATYEVSADRSYGVITLDGNGTYDRDYHIDLDFSATIPESCIEPLTCDVLPGFSNGLVDSCTDAGDACDCQGTYVGDDAATGTWVKDGDDVITDGSERTELCIVGDAADTLHQDGTRVRWSR